MMEKPYLHQNDRSHCFKCKEGKRGTSLLIMEIISDYVMMMKTEFSQKGESSHLFQTLATSLFSLLQPRPACWFPFYVWFMARAAFYSLEHLQVRNHTHLQRELVRDPLI